MARQNLENEELGGIIRAKINDNFSELYGNAGLVTSVQPTISSDFTRNDHKLYEQYGLEPKTITQMYDVVRASTATYVDATGKIRTAGVNEPRIDYSSGQGRLLVEEARTNLLRRSNTLEANWATADRVSITDSGIPSPVVGQNWVRLTEVSTTTSEYYADHSQSVTSGLVYTFSCYVAENTERDFSLRLPTQFSGERCVFNTSTGSFTVTGGATAEKCIGGWRIFMTATATATGTAIARLQLIVKGGSGTMRTGAGLSCLVIAPQLEQASTPSSYIPTEASAVTRAADSVSRVLGDEFNDSEFSVYCECNAVTRTSGGTLFQVQSSNGINEAARALWTNNTNLRIEVRNQSGSYSVIRDYSIPEGQNIKIVINATTNGLLGAVNGISSGNIVGYVPQNITGLGIAQRIGSNRLAAEYTNLKIYPRALSEQECIQLTKV